MILITITSKPQKYWFSCELAYLCYQEKKLKRQRSAFGAAELKIGGVYMPGDVVPRDEMSTPRSSSLTDNSELGANEEVMEDGQETDTESLLNPDYGHSQSSTSVITPKQETEPESNYIYACNICGEQYPVKEDCENHLRVHTGKENCWLYQC